MSDASNTTTRGKRIRWMLAGLLSGLALLVVLLQASGATPSGILRTLGAIHWPFYALIMAGQSVMVLIAALKWRIVLSETLNYKAISLGAATSATATGTLLGQVLSIQISVPIVRAWVARKYGIGAHAAAGTSLFEQSLELLTLGLAALTGVLLVTFGPVVAGIVMLALLLVWVPILKPTLRFSSQAVRAIGKFLRIGSATTILADGLNQAADQSPAVLQKLIGLSVLRYALIAVFNVGIVMMLLPGLDPLPLFVAYPLILLLSSVPFLPAGLGVAEVTWTSALLLQGIDAATAAETAVSLRIVSFGGFLLAYPFLLLMGRKTRQ